MKANAVPLLDIFEKKMRIEVPLFQRQYVWSREQQWEPLWEDIVRKFTEYLDDRKDAPAHFLGAMVLDQKLTPTTHVEKRQVIDGQQRLTTLQVFLAAFRDFCRGNGCEDLAKECDSYTLNKGMMTDPTVDRFKVWPTQVDRPEFSNVITSGSRESLEAKYPLHLRPRARKPDPRPLMVEAYLFFYDQMSVFFLGEGEDTPIAGDIPLAMRLEECFQALKNALQVVVVDLEQDDDAQIIFETLNARGEPLLPADLLRNFIFLRAGRQGESQEELYEHYWRKFDDPFWREEVVQGRLNRPRSDLFMQHFLASKQAVDIPVKHLFVEYKFWIKRDRPFVTVREEVATLARQADGFRRMLQPKEDDVLFPLLSFLIAYDVSTAYPLLLHLLESGLTESQWRAVSEMLESYLLRRAVCGQSSKNSNRVFLTLTRTLRRDGTTVENIRQYLSGLSGESAEWPMDDVFGNAWHNRPVYQALQNPKIGHILRRLNDAHHDSRGERITIHGNLSIEHILPQEWIERWPLPDGSRGMTLEELYDAKPEDPRAELTRRRNSALDTLGNLTIVTQSLNSSVSNGAWKEKKIELLNSSLLPLNQQLRVEDHWDESAIQGERPLYLSERGKYGRDHD
jgi:hypothetical protein